MTADQKIARAASEIATHHKVIGMLMRAYKDRIEDLKRAIMEVEYQEELMKEYDIE